MTKRKRYTKPDDQSAISAFFVASLVVTNARVTDEQQPENRPDVRAASIDVPSGEGGAPVPSGPEAASGAHPTRSTPTTRESTRSEANNNAAAPVTVNRKTFMKKTAERKAKFTRTSKHKVGWDPEWTKLYKWLVPVEDEGGEVVGMLCSTCQLHNQAQWNGQMYWVKEPVACLRIDTVTDHLVSFQHKRALRKDQDRLASARNGGIARAFQQVVSVQREALIKATKTLYFLAKEEIAHTTKFASLLDFAKDHLGCDVLSHLAQGRNANYKSERILQEVLQVLADQLQADHSAWLADSTYFGLQVDETTDITTTKELVLLTRMIKDGEVVNRFAGMVEVDDGKANTISSAIRAWIQQKGLDVKKLMGFGSDGAPVYMTTVESWPSCLTSSLTICGEEL